MAETLAPFVTDNTSLFYVLDGVNWEGERFTTRITLTVMCPVCKHSCNVEKLGQDKVSLTCEKGDYYREIERAGNFMLMDVVREHAKLPENPPCSC
jgi:hypothetical protein